MSELKPNQHQPIVPTPEQVNAWMQVADEIAPTGQLVSLDRGSGPEELVLTDTVYQRSVDAEGHNVRKPIVVVETVDGQKQVIDAADYLSWTNFDFNSLPSELETAPVPAPIVEYAGSLLVEQVMSEAETYKLERAKQLFVPIESSEPDQIESHEEEPNFDFMFAKDDAEYAGGLEAFKAANPEKSSTKVTGSSEADYRAASGEISDALSADDNMYRIFEKFDLVTKPRAEMIKQLRTNAELRLELGQYLQAKLDKPDIAYHMPERIARNTQKSPSLPRYQTAGNYLSSREYTCLLALSMLDGSFDIKNSESDTVTYDPKTQLGVGQHRFAARKLLAESVYDKNSTLEDYLNSLEK